MKFEKEILEDHRAKFTVPVEDERVQREMKTAAKRIAKHVNIPGFRKGKAPYHVIARQFGEDAILDEALEKFGQDIYLEVLQDSEITPYSAGSLEDVQREPFVLTFVVPLAPEVELGAYRDVRLPFAVEEVKAEDVEKTLDSIREQQATMEPVERAIEMGDVAMMDIVGTLVRDDDEPATEESDETGQERNDTWLARKGVRVRISEDSTYPVPGFVQQVIGMSKEDHKEFDITFTEDDEKINETLRGKTLHFDVTCDEVFEYELPQLDDELAKSTGDYNTLDELKQAIEKDLQEQLASAAEREYFDKIVEHLLESVISIKYPTAMLEDQIDDLLEDFSQDLSRQGLKLEDYMKLQNLDEEQLREDMRENAARQLQRALILGEVIGNEQLKVTDADIEDQIDTMVLSFGTDAGLAKQVFSSDQSKRTIASQLLAEKAVNRLVLIAKGEAPEIGEDNEETEDDEAVSEDEIVEADTPAEKAAEDLEDESEEETAEGALDKEEE